MKQEEHDSKSLFEGKTAPAPEVEEKPAKGLGAVGKIAIVAALAVCVVAVIMFKNSGAAAQAESDGPVAMNTDGRALPRLIELGSVSCIPCKLMAPILDELRKEYPDTLRVEFIDIKKDEAAADKFAVSIMPTQVFLDADGNELFRHEGFFPKAEILAKWKELGVDLDASKQ